MEIPPLPAQRGLGGHYGLLPPARTALALQRLVHFIVMYLDTSTWRPSGCLLCWYINRSRVRLLTESSGEPGPVPAPRLRVTASYGSFAREQQGGNVGDFTLRDPAEQPAGRELLAAGGAATDPLLHVARGLLGQGNPWKDNPEWDAIRSEAEAALKNVPVAFEDYARKRGRSYVNKVGAHQDEPAAVFMLGSIEASISENYSYSRERFLYFRPAELCRSN